MARLPESPVLILLVSRSLAGFAGGPKALAPHPGGSRDNPLPEAVLEDNFVLAMELLKKGADVNAKGAMGMTPLATALDFERKGYRFDYRPTVKLLRRHGGHE